ncbi:ROK family protein [Brucella sp. BE17]|uniref:ROK family protein n=1 Tax=Brucella sp. BE17 TaxID=3142977 RepID=UPI0031BA06AD
MKAEEKVALSEVAQAVFARLLAFGEATRKLLVENTGFSFPTVTVALSELSSADMVCELRREQGPRGRATIIYGVSDGAGWVLGVDIGSTQISFISRELNGRIIDQATLKHDKAIVSAGQQAGELVRQSKAIKSFLTSPLAVAVALNQVVPRQLNRSDYPMPRALEIAQTFASHSGLSLSIPFLLENNVNCAAVAEHQDGQLHGHDDAAYMQIGVGIGLGFFSDGALIRGGHGGSGELAQIPLSWSDRVVSNIDAIEQKYGSAGLMHKAYELMRGETDCPSSPEELFSLASQGHEQAQVLVTEYGVALGRIAATAATILDPSILVLGGGLSRNAAFAGIIVGEFESRNRSTTITLSQKGPEATVVGACLLARDYAVNRIVGRYHRPICARPTLMPACIQEE